MDRHVGYHQAYDFFVWSFDIDKIETFWKYLGTKQR